MVSSRTGARKNGLMLVPSEAKCNANFRLKEGHSGIVPLPRATVPRKPQGMSGTPQCTITPCQSGRSIRMRLNIGQ